MVDASLNKLISITTYNAESVGKSIELINPKNLSQMCSGYGRIVKENYRKEHTVVLYMVLFLIEIDGYPLTKVSEVATGTMSIMLRIKTGNKVVVIKRYAIS